MTPPPQGTYTPANWGEVIPSAGLTAMIVKENFRNNIETYRLSQYVLVKVYDPEDIIAKLKELHRSLDVAT